MRASFVQGADGMGLSLFPAEYVQHLCRIQGSQGLVFPEKKKKKLAQALPYRARKWPYVTL